MAPLASWADRPFMDAPRHPAPPNLKPRFGRFGALILLTVIFTIAAGVFGPFMSSARTSPDTRAPGLTGSDGRVLIGRTLGRSHRLVIYMTTDGARYTITDNSGRILAEDLPEDDVYRAFPDLDPGSLHAGTSGDHRLMLVDPDQ